MTRKVFAKGMAIFMAATRLKYSKGDQEIFYSLMEDLDDDVFLNAIRSVCKHHEEIYPNTNIVALIQGACMEISSPKISPAEAWGQLIDYAAGKINYGDIDQNALKAFDALGFEFHSIAQGRGFEAPPEKLGYMRRDFIQFYKDYQEKTLSMYKQIGIGGSEADKRVGGGFQKIGGK